LESKFLFILVISVPIFASADEKSAFASIGFRELRLLKEIKKPPQPTDKPGKVSLKVSSHSRHCEVRSNPITIAV